MNIFVRWGRFSIVGAMGFALQLAALVLFSHLWRGHYSIASVAATEVTLLHNFAWHWHYTWRDRRERLTVARQLVRFHLSNGLVSLLGNLLFVRLLVHETHVPLIAANVCAVLLCSVANFYLGDRWAFARWGDRLMLSAGSLQVRVAGDVACGKPTDGLDLQ
jgi:putative flippase GtrA